MCIGILRCGIGRVAARIVGRTIFKTALGVKARAVGTRRVVRIVRPGVRRVVRVVVVPIVVVVFHSTNFQDKVSCPAQYRTVFPDAIENEKIFVLKRDLSLLHNYTSNTK